MEEVKSILKETLEQINEFRNDYISNEQAVRTQLIEPVLNVLGWKTSNPKFVRPNAPDEDGKIPDYSLLKNGKTILIVEAKNLKSDLQDKKIIDQLANYCYKSGINFGVLTNGAKWLLFKTFENNPKDRIIWQVNIESDKIEVISQNLSLFSYHNIDKLDAMLKKRKILDEVWQSLVESTDSIISIVAQKLSEQIKIKDPLIKIEISEIKSFTGGKIAELFEFAEVEEENDTEIEKAVVEESEFTAMEDVIFKRRNRSAKREKISVKFPDNIVINRKRVIDTFVECIEKIGTERILPLNIYRSGVPIVSISKDNFYNQRKLGKYWIMSCTSTKEKLAVLNEINEKLNLNLVIETFIDDKDASR